MGGYIIQEAFKRMKDIMERRAAVDHPAHYGGKDNPYEAIKVIEAWGLGFCLGIIYLTPLSVLPIIEA